MSLIIIIIIIFILYILSNTLDNKIISFTDKSITQYADLEDNIKARFKCSDSCILKL